MYVEVLTPNTSEGDLSGQKGLSSQGKMKSLGWAPIQYNWCPYKKGHLDTETDIHEGKVM